MEGQVLGGGVIVLVAALLWLVYLLPTWNARRQFDAAERNAVRLNQALRILAETSETPDEVRLELNARTALQQQKLARRIQAEQESARLEQARAELLAARQAPAARRARARRHARLIATMLLVGALALIGWGVWHTVQTGSQVILWSGAAVGVVALAMLQRMARVQARAARRAADVSVTADSEPLVAPMEAIVDVELPVDTTGWTPQPLPRPLQTAQGSLAAAHRAAADARAALRQAARDEELRERAERLQPAPTPITAAAGSAAAAPTPAAPITAAAGDDAIEAHVRALLQRRAVGE